MRITAPVMKRLILIQANQLTNHLDSGFYQYNRFVLFSITLSISSKTALKALISEEEYTELEIEEYMAMLEAKGISDKKDLVLVSQIEKNFKSIDYEQEIQIIIDHYNRVSNSNSKGTKSAKKAIKSILTSEDIEITDLKKVSLYYTRLWQGCPTMSRYVTLDSFFRITKFEEKLEAANKYFDDLNKFSDEVALICKNFKSEIMMEFSYKNKSLANSFCPAEMSCENMPLQLQEKIIHWIKQGFNVLEIIETIKLTILSWSKNQKYAKHSNLSKILDEKFPDRAVAAKRMALKSTQLKNSVKSGNDWLNKSQPSKNKNMIGQ